MEPNDIASLAKRVHDAERWDLGARSTRETRNAFWARVVGIVHHGHPVYNAAPDSRWHLKSGGGGRPQSDDVAVRMPDRHFWDFIGGVGADGYTFGASGDHGPLPPEQPVFPPPVPDGGGVAGPPAPSKLWTAEHQRVREALGPNADTKRIAEQFAYAFPAEGWGQKRADGSRPVSNDVIARTVDGVLYGMRVVPQASGSPFSISGQVFVAVSAVNHLGEPPVAPPSEPPPAGPPPVPPARDYGPRFDDLASAIAALALQVTTQRQELIDTVKGQTYDIDVKAGPLGRVKGTITPKAQS